MGADSLNSARRRRTYTRQFKAEMVAQCMQGNVSLASLALVDVRLLDHFIVAGATVLPMAERGGFSKSPSGKPAGLPFLLRLITLG